mmetsp:Transcript_4064/g.3431  ORF Transcript_4064/g.3431 Transcript_4064/m.3431 type:complete len:112 (-) Transcript_4064:231-566(-)
MKLLTSSLLLLLVIAVAGVTAKDESNLRASRRLQVDLYSNGGQEWKRQCKEGNVGDGPNADNVNYLCQAAVKLFNKNYQACRAIMDAAVNDSNAVSIDTYCNFIYSAKNLK